MPDKPYLIAVDDEVMNLQIIRDILEDEFEIHTMDNGQECLDSLEQRIPDIVLLDVMMPVLDGLETCKLIRGNPVYKDIPVIFVSALASSAEKMRGYGAGGDDYLTKPFDEEELITKIHLLLKIKTEKNKGIEEKEFATKTAMTSMIGASEAGHLVYFMQSMLVINELDALLELIASVLNKYGLEGSVMLTHLDEPVYYFTDEKMRSIEMDILKETAGQSSKIIEFTGRAVIIGKHASLLIRNMPADEETVGRYRDHLAVFIDSLDVKLLQFIVDANINKHYSLLKQTVESISKELDVVHKSSQNQRMLNSSILGELAHDIEKSFLQLGLDESEEAELVQLISKAEIETDKVYESGKQSEKIFDRIVDKLNQLLN